MHVYLQLVKLFTSFAVFIVAPSFRWGYFDTEC